MQGKQKRAASLQEGGDASRGQFINGNYKTESGSIMPPSGQAMTRSQRGALAVLFTSLLLDLIAFTMILPIMPRLLDYYGHQDKGGLYGFLRSSVAGFRTLVGAPDTPKDNAVLFGGLIGSLFSLLQFLAAPIFGAASDAYGRKPILILTMVGVAASYVVWALSHNFTLFVIARIIGGLSKGNISLSTAIVADILPKEKRGKGMALVGVAFSVGFIVGPLIGAYFSRLSITNLESSLFYQAPAWIAFTLALFDVFMLAVCFKETLPVENRAKSLWGGMERTCHLVNPAALFRFKAVTGLKQSDMVALRKIGYIYFLYLFIYSGLEFTLTFLTYTRFNYDSMQQGKMFLFIGMIMIIVQGGFVRRLKPGSEKDFAVKGMTILLPSFLVVGFAPNPAVMFGGLILYSFGSATVVPCLTTIVSSYGSADQKGTVMGIFRSLGALARALGPVIISTVYYSVGAQISYLIGGILMAVPVALLCRVNLKSPKE